MGSLMFYKGKEKVKSGVSSFFELSAKDIDGKVVNMNQYSERKLLLIVNVASNCGLTKKNYQQLNELYEQYKQEGLEILAFPSNDFMSQEPDCGAVLNYHPRTLKKWSETPTRPPSHSSKR
jgi:glutathione peroxidase-family protein